MSAGRAPVAQGRLSFTRELGPPVAKSTSEAVEATLPPTNPKRPAIQSEKLQKMVDTIAADCHHFYRFEDRNKRFLREEVKCLVVKCLSQCRYGVSASRRHTGYEFKGHAETITQMIMLAKADSLNYDGLSQTLSREMQEYIESVTRSHYSENLQSRRGARSHPRRKNLQSGRGAGSHSRRYSSNPDFFAVKWPPSGPRSDVPKVIAYNLESDSFHSCRETPRKTKATTILTQNALSSPFQAGILGLQTGILGFHGSFHVFIPNRRAIKP
ncbi:hypothetical protein B0H16DRAFT_960937 [Mycena metata]|uniref:Uncharacterized protein n=1 Tax=Mycena metata TaxID=1033252 RepID=A0AAD7N6D8_9AGAR|nr:hypothetical protein B0H16DRAFT_960937 [Mycena metata]